VQCTFRGHSGSGASEAKPQGNETIEKKASGRKPTEVNLDVQASRQSTQNQLTADSKKPGSRSVVTVVSS